MTMQNFKHYFIQRRAESGRGFVEVMAVLAIMGVLSVGGLWFYNVSKREKQINDIIYYMNLEVAQIYPALQKRGDFESKDELNKFLGNYRMQVGSYVLTFQADPNSSGNDFVTQVMHLDGSPIKGAMCRNLISKMSKLKTVQDVSFSLQNEEMDDGSVSDVTIPLNGRVIDYDALCGSD